MLVRSRSANLIASIRQVESERDKQRERAEKAEAALVAEKQAVRDAKSTAAMYQRDFDAELEGNKSLRERFGALENETFPGFVGRLAAERDAAVKRAEKAEAEQSSCCRINRADAEAARAALREMQEQLTGQEGYTGKIADLLALRRRELDIACEQVAQLKKERDRLKAANDECGELQDKLNADVERLKMLLRRAQGWIAAGDGCHCVDCESKRTLHSDIAKELGG